MDPRNEILRLAKAGGRHSPVLVIRQRNLLACVLLDHLGNRVVSNRKCEDLRHRSGQICHRQLTFPGLTDPSLFGNLLDIPRSLP